MVVPTAIVCPATPEVDESVIHDWFVVAVQVNDPPPVFETLSDCAVGLLDPGAALKKRFDGATQSDGVVGDTTPSEMPIVAEEGAAPAALMSTVALYCAAARLLLAG